MSSERNGSGRAGRLAFRPNVDGDLETRCLLSSAHPAAAQVHHHFPPEPIHISPFNGGQGVRIKTASGQFFDIHLTGGGVVRAFPMRGGKYEIRVDGSNVTSVLSIDPVVRPGPKGFAHDFSFGQINQTQILQVGKLLVTSGQISQILGYRTAILSGPLVVAGSNPVDRIAFYQLVPGAQISVANDLNTLDVFNDATLSGTPGIFVGRDLNWLNIGGNLSLTNGASLVAARDIGLVAQPAKGTDPGGQGGLIAGNLFLSSTSTFGAGRSIDAPIIIRGSLMFQPGAQLLNDQNNQVFSLGGFIPV